MLGFTAARVQREARPELLHDFVIVAFLVAAARALRRHMRMNFVRES